MPTTTRLARASEANSAAERVFTVAARVAAEDDVKAAVEANHDQNRWWPTTVADWRLRMLIAGWSTRISYNMIDTYSAVVATVTDIGYDDVNKLSDADVHQLVEPLGLMAARRRYMRSLHGFLRAFNEPPIDPLRMDNNRFIQVFAENVEQAGYKVAQCAVLYSRGYHSGIIPIDSGMVSKLAPRLGLDPGRGPRAHNTLRLFLESCVQRDSHRYRTLIDELGYAVDIPPHVAPTWWLHLVLIYFKRLYCNRPSPRLCRRMPMCDQVLDCACLRQARPSAEHG